jgi:general stress protein 26
MHHEPTDRAAAITRLNELIKGIKFAMLTTVEEDGSLRSRPMTVQENEFDGDLWFFTEADAPKVDEIQHDRQVNVSLAEPKDQRYISLSGTARLIRDVQKQRELWSEPNKIWFPNGPEDPNLALLKVSVARAEYWESGSNAVGRLFDFAKAYVTGDQGQVGENQKLDLSH